MDEHMLNDLLECSVCLERLDTSSKVLPCQHTFCRKCLEVIVSSRQELRCPECRDLVDLKIDDLPPNVLLMRILEGMKNAAASKTQLQQKNQQQQQQQSHLQQQKSHQQATPTSLVINQPQPPQRLCSLPHAYAMHDFESSESNDLSFKKGDFLLLKSKIDDNWYFGQANGTEGTFPINYVKVIVPLKIAQCIALYDFKMGPNEEEGCLSFKKGALINVLRRVDHNWAEGSLNNTIGIFPIAFVRLNAVAEQVLATKNKVSEQPKSNSSATTVTTNTINSYNNTANNSSSCSSSQNNSNENSSENSPIQTEENTPQHDRMVHAGHEDIQQMVAGVQLRNRESHEKRHSLNGLFNVNDSIVPIGVSNDQRNAMIAINRHSAEILSVPHESESTSTTKSTSGAVAGEKNMNTFAIPQTTIAREQQYQQQTQVRCNVMKSPLIVQQHMIPPTLPWSYLALYPYKPRKPDELELKKGCVYIVTERCLDGWFKGKNWQNTMGVFPGNYVTPMRPRDQKQVMHQWKHAPMVSLESTAATTTTLAPSSKSSRNSNEHVKNILPILQIPPPDAPPRHIASVSPTPPPPPSPSASTTTTCASVWTKPLGHTVEAFFHRHNNNNNNHNTISNSKTNLDKNKESNAALSSSAATGSTSSATGTAVSLMKRLANMKSRSKSPAALATTSLTVNHEDENKNIMTQQQQQFQSSHPVVHVRSGSCPSQLLHNLPKQQQHQPATPSNEHILYSLQQNLQQQQQQQQHQKQQRQPEHLGTTNNYGGSQRLKGCKERPSLQNTRKSLDSNIYRNVYINIHHQQQQQQQQQHSQSQTTLQPINHRKSQSLDANTILRTNAATGLQHSMVSNTTTNSNSTQNLPGCRFRCIVPYPPNSEFELELHVGDIIYVHRKPKNGWFKGTCTRTNKTGLFPASFVELDA